MSKNTITIEVTAADDCGTIDNSAIEVDGVRLSLAGSGQDSITASISATGDVRLPGGSNQLTVISKVVDELVDDGVSAETLTLIRHTGDPEGDSEYFKLLIEENAVDSFKDAALDLDFSGIQTGMTLELDAWVSTKEDLEDLKPTQFVLVANDDGLPAEVDESEDNVLTNSAVGLLRRRRY